MSLAVEVGSKTHKPDTRALEAESAPLLHDAATELPNLGSGTSSEEPRDEAGSVGPALHHTNQHSFLQAFQSLLYVIIIALFIITFTVQPFRIPSLSMEPTLQVGDFLLVDKQVGEEVPPRVFAPISEIRRGDLIVFHYPVDPSLHVVKRVIGLPGDQIRLRDGRVFIDSHPLDEPYAVFQPSAPDPYRDDFPTISSADPDVDYQWWVKMRSLISNGELTVPRGNYFVLGDNRNDSKDSRYWGFVPAADIVGKPVLVYFSLNTSSDGSSQPGSKPGFARWDRTFRILR